MSARYMQPLRTMVQLGFFGFILWAGLRFYRFVQDVSTDGTFAVTQRPDAIDGFLPISGLLGTASWANGYGINPVHPAAVVIFITVIAVSLLLRRSFCSWICPVAFISECLWKAGFKLLRRNVRLPYLLDCCLRSIKYLLMVFFVYSVAVAMSPESMQVFIQSDYHKTADVRLLYFFLRISPSALLFLIIISALSIVLRNPFCRYLCPYGALLGLAGVLSPLRVTRDSDRCVSCGACSQVCPTYIDVMRKTSVTSPECIACWRCISHCRFNESLSMRAVRHFAVPGFVFALLVVLLFWGGSFIGSVSGHWHSSITLEEYARLLGK